MALLKLALRFASTLLASLLAVLPLLAYGADVRVDAEFARQSLGTGLLVLEDSGREFSIDTVLGEAGWQIYDSEVLNFGFTDSAYWLRFSVVNESMADLDLLFDIAYAPMDRVDLYLFRGEEVIPAVPGSSMEHYRLGDTIPYSQRIIAHANLLAPLHLSPNESVDIIMRAQTEGAMQLPISLWSEAAFAEADFKNTARLGIFFGMLLFAACYQLLIYFSVKDNSFLLYALFVFSVLILLLCIRGIPNALFWPDSVFFTDTILVLSQCVAMYTASLFCIEILAVEESRPFYARLLRIGAYAAAGVGLISLFLPYRLGLLAAVSLALCVTLLNLVVFVLRFKDGYPPAKYILAMAVCTSIAIFIGIVSNLGWFPKLEFVNHWYFGLIIMVFAYSFTLSFRMNMDRREREKAQRLAYETQQESLETQERLNIDLDRLVKERTREKEKVTQLLQATKEMSSSSDKVEAVRVGLRHMLALFPELVLQDADCFLKSHTSNLFARYPIWRNQAPVNDSVPQEPDPIILDKLQALNESSLEDRTLYIPIKSEKRLCAVLMVTEWRGGDQSPDADLLANIAQSLALTMENIEAEESSRLSMIGGMAAAIVHDLRNPIGAITGCAELAADDKTSATEREAYLKTIVAESKRMSNISNEVLEVSREKIPLNLQHVSAAEFLDDVSKAVRQLPNAKGIEIEARCEIADSIEIDVSRMHRALLNLADNACDAICQTKSGAGRFILYLIRKGDDIVLVAGDNGVGIPGPIQATLFEPFVTYGKTDGTGLGMAIVKKVVDAHGGQIEFRSVAGEGTEFEIVLPQPIPAEAGVDRAVEAPSTSCDHPVEPLQKRKVLVADDNPVNTMVVSKMLSKLGMEVIAVSDGQQVLDKVVEESFDCVLMDIEMPNLNGFEAANEIRNRDGLSKLPIIALTGHSSAAQMEKCRRYGMDGIITKPIGSEDLRQTFRELFPGG